MYKVLELVWQLTDNDCEGIPAIGFWCDYSKDASCSGQGGGEFLFSEWNIFIPFSGEGSVLIWNSTEEHGTTVYDMPFSPEKRMIFISECNTTEIHQ